MLILKELLLSGFYLLLVTISKLLPKWDKDKIADYYLPVKNYRFKLPINIVDFPPSFANFFITYNDFPPIRIFMLDNVYVLGAGVVFKNLRIFFPSLPLEEDYKAFRHGSILFSQFKKETSVVNGNAALVYNYWGLGNYYHWIIDSLSRILLLKKKHSDITLILPAHFPEYMRRSIEILECNKYVFLDNNQIIKVPKLLFPELTSNIEYQHPYLTKELRDIFYKKLNLGQSKPNRFIYVSRNRQSKRVLLNEEKLQLLLKKFEFEIVYLEEMVFDEQLQLFAQTNIIISVHGANLTNILFMQPSSIVIELMNKDFNNSTYFNLSSILNLNYYCIACKPHYNNVSYIDYISRNNASLTINLLNLENVLNNLFDK